MYLVKFNLDYYGKKITNLEFGLDKLPSIADGYTYTVNNNANNFILATKHSAFDDGTGYVICLDRFHEKSTWPHHNVDFIAVVKKIRLKIYISNL